MTAETRKLPDAVHPRQGAGHDDIRCSTQGNATGPTAQELRHLGVLAVRIDAQRAQERSILDQLGQATGAHWRRRAAALEWARPRPGDYRGQATAADIEARDQRLADAAAACRQRATAFEQGRLDPIDAAELRELLDDINNHHDRGVLAS